MASCVRSAQDWRRAVLSQSHRVQRGMRPSPAWFGCHAAQLHRCLDDADLPVFVLFHSFTQVQLVSEASVNPFTLTITWVSDCSDDLCDGCLNRALRSHVRSAASPGALHLEPVVPWLVPTARSTHHVTVWLLCAGCGTTSMRWCESC